jgi:hypothetical protein
MNKIKWFFKNLINTLFNDKEGFSMRKCLALVMVKVTIVMEFAYISSDNIEGISIINFAFVGLLIGVVTMQNIIELKNGK